MEIRQVITAEQKKEFDNPFPTPKGQVVQPHYAFFIPEESNKAVDKLVAALSDADMNVKLFAVDGGVSVKAQFGKPSHYSQAESILLPVLQSLGIPQFTVFEGDIATFDNQGELISWISSDLLELCDEDDDDC